MAPPIDYEPLRLIWWLLLGVLLIGFTLTDGFDLGTAALLPFVAKTDEERRLVINSIGATWEGNQVWFILGGGAIFAAWPFVYAVSFSGFYLAMFLVLSALILRPVGFKYRSKKPDAAWRTRWDWALFVGGFVPALVFGVAVGNVLTGIPFRLDSDLRAFYEGTLLGLFHPFSLVFDPQWTPRHDYFAEGPIEEPDGVGDYVADSGETLALDAYHAGVEEFRNPNPAFEFYWGVGEVVSALVEAGLTLERLVEYPYSNGWAAFANMQDLGGGRLAPPPSMPRIPLMYGLSATRPG